MVTIQKPTLVFLKDLDRNNYREWFIENKDRYLSAQENMVSFLDALIGLMNQHDNISETSGRKCLYRIYNDVRFHKDKAPYNPRFAAGMGRVKPYLRGGYYIQIKPGKSHVSCGFFAPNPEDLKRIRLDILHNPEHWNRILKSKQVRENFGSLTGESVNTVPRGFPGDSPSIDLIRHKQFILKRTFSDREVLADNFLQQINNTFKSVRKFFDYMSEVLTTDLNGEPLINRSV